MEETVIIGEQDVSRAATVRRQINKLIKAANSHLFDIMDLLHEVKTKNYYTGWGFESYPKYAESLEIAYARGYYLVRIKENMVAAGLERADYENLGMAKLRAISRLKPDEEFQGTPISLLIRELTLKAKDMTTDEVEFEVSTIMGQTGDESMVWMNVRVKKLAKDNVIKPALSKAKRYMGQTKDEDGHYIDASDGAAFEMIAADFLADPNYETVEPEVPAPVGVSMVGEPTVDLGYEEQDIQDQ